MSSGFGELTVQAHQLVSAGDLAGAQQLLSDALTDADPRPANADPDLAEAAGLQARVLVALGEPHPARGWAAFAYAAMTRLYGQSDQRTIAAAATLAAVLHRVGSYARAARLYQEVIIELTAGDGPESLRVLAAHADLATVEYARGECAIARDRLGDAWELHREVYGDGHPSGIKMLARLGAMQRDCGHFAEGHQNLALARDLCRQHLPADDPLAAQVAALARAAARPRHVCATAPARDEPVVPAARTPSAAEGGPGAAYPGYAPPPATYPHSVPGQRHPMDSAERADARRMADDGADDDDRWPPENTVAPDEPAANHHPAGAAVPPSVVALAGPADDPDGVRRVRNLPERRPPARLPVRVHRPPAHRSRRLAPVVVGGVVVVLLGTGAVIAGVAGFDEPRVPVPARTPTSTVAAATGTPAGVTAAPPTRVAVRDTRDSIALSWTYPPGAEGPVVISGGRTGQDPTVLANLPAGTNSYVVYGLGRTNDYCFTVAVVYSADTIGRSRPVCTRRR